MPKGKTEPKGGGIGQVNREPLSGTVWEMRRLAKKGVAPLGRGVMKRHSGTLRVAFRYYQIKRKGAVTATSRRRVRDLIAKRAGKVLRTPESETWRENLLDALECTLDNVTSPRGNGSCHLYLRVPKDVVIPSGNGKIAPGIDVRGNDGA